MSFELTSSDMDALHAVFAARLACSIPTDCIWCGDPIPEESTYGRFCNGTHYYQYKITLHKLAKPRQCHKCGRIIPVWRKSSAKFCSDDCYQMRNSARMPDMCVIMK